MAEENEGSYEISVGEGEDVTTIDLGGLGDEQKATIIKYGKDNWRDMLSDEYATDATLADFKDFDNVVKSYKNSQSMVGRDKIAIPGEDAEQAEIDAYYNKLGRPETAEEYKLGRVKDAPEGWDITDSEKEFANISHKLGISNAQADGLWQYMQQQAVDSAAGSKSSKDKRVYEDWEGFKKEQGAAYDGNLKKVNALIAKFGDQDTIDWLQKSGIGKEVKLVKFALNIAKSMGEDTLEIESAPKASIYTPKEAQSKMNKIMADKSSPFWHRDHPEFENTMAEVDRLQRMITGEFEGERAQ